MKFSRISLKQRKLLNWWVDSSPVRDAYGIIAEGAIRSGKTSCMSMAFIEWAMSGFDERKFIISGKTVGSLKRNVLDDLIPHCKRSGYIVETKLGEGFFTLEGYGNKNKFHIFGGQHEGSYELVQGITAAGALFDEAVLMPQSFVDQAMGRCSVDRAKLWFNLNPAGPSHWMKKLIVDRAKERNLLKLHFTMDDNPGLSEDRKHYFRSSWKPGSVFYRRYINGEWAQAEGAIYDMLGMANFYTKRPYEWMDGCKWYVSVDYGTQNATTFLLILFDGKHSWVEKEYYHSGRESMQQKTNTEYAQDFVDFVGSRKITAVIVDPSAASFKLELSRKGFNVVDADNEVLEGIEKTSQLIYSAHLQFNTIHCPKVIESLQSYVWDPKPTEKGNEKPIKVDDHGADAVRYYCNTVLKYYVIK